MRLVLRAMCAAALVGCSDVKPPAEPSSSLTPSQPSDQHPEVARPHDTIDPRPVSLRLEDLLGKGLARVSIPADEFSQSPDAVHPDITCPPASWMGAACWLMYT